MLVSDHKEVKTMSGFFDFTSSLFDDPYENTDNGYNTDEWLKPCTDSWRDSHPFGYNQYTGGWNAEEDEANGW